MARTDLGSLTAGDKASEHGMLQEILHNQLYLMMAFSAANDLPYYPKAGRKLLDEDESKHPDEVHQRQKNEFEQRALAAGLKWQAASETWIDRDGFEYDELGQHV